MPAPKGKASRARAGSGGGGGGKGFSRQRSKAPPPPRVEYDDDGYSDGYYSEDGHPDQEALSAAWSSVVKVLCTHAEPNYSLPWQMRKQHQSSSTGFVIDLKRRWILTNAHSVEHHTQVRLKKRGSETKHVATVLAIGRECDIALLTVSDDGKMMMLSRFACCPSR